MTCSVLAKIVVWLVVVVRGEGGRHCFFHFFIIQKPNSNQISILLVLFSHLSLSFLKLILAFVLLLKS
jgi:hypothetical protein